MPLRQGEIVLVPVPFTDLSSYRRRPVIVVSNDAYQVATADFVAGAMTSNLKDEPYSFEVTPADVVQGTLNRSGRVRVDKIVTLAQSIVVSQFARVSDAVLIRIRQELGALTS